MAKRARELGPGVIEHDLTADSMRWADVVAAVAGGAPDPFAVEAVRGRAEESDPQAVELYAWMHANGIGVQRDLHRAFNLYLKADSLGVPGAKDNAKAVFRSLPPAERDNAGVRF